MKKYFSLFFILFYLILPHPVFAENYGLSVSPPLLRVHIQPGKSITQVFKIENLSNSPQTLVTSIVPFSTADNFGNPILNPKANAPWLNYFSLTNSQIRLDQPFFLAQGATEQLILNLNVPANAPSQDIYATLTISTYENSLPKTTDGTVVRATIGANLLITINSQAYPDTFLKISDFYPTEGTLFKIGSLIFADSLTPLKLTAKINNEGNFSAETKGVFRVTAHNQPVFLDGILPVNVIAKSQRQLVNTAGQAFEFVPSLGQIGPHQISLEIKTDNSNTKSTFDIFFFPFKLSLGLLISLLIILSIAKITTKKNHQKNN